MPVKWTPENDQRLLMLIIEVCKVQPDVKLIADRWTPKDGEDRPTPRAIGERIHKIRNQIKANGGEMRIINKNGGGKSGPKADTKAGTADSKTKGNAKAQKNVVANRSGTQNFLTALVDKDDESEDEAKQMPTPPGSTKRKRSLPLDAEFENEDAPSRKAIKVEPLDFDGAMDVGNYTLLSNSIADEA